MYLEKRQTDRQTETDRQTDRQTDTERERDRQRAETETQRERGYALGMEEEKTNGKTTETELFIDTNEETIHEENE